MKNVQISFDENLLKQVDKIAKSSAVSRSAIVREALKIWIRRKEIKQFEDEWITKLKEHPDDEKEADKWIKAELWGE
jgi:metal-responsive CopG/Arc/MetJ family transcriptional regulator